MPLEFRQFNSADVDDIKSRFEEAYTTLFGRTIEGLSIEITNWSLIVATHVPEPVAVKCQNTGQAASVKRMRGFYDAARRSNVEAQEIERTVMQAGVMVEGPAVIIEQETSTIVTSGYRAIGQSDGSMLLLAKGI